MNYLTTHQLGTLNTSLFGTAYSFLAPVAE